MSLAGLKTITIKNLAVTRTSLALSSLIISNVKQHLIELASSVPDKQSSILVRNFDNAAKDYQVSNTVLLVMVNNDI